MLLAVLFASGSALDEAHSKTVAGFIRKMGAIHQMKDATNPRKEAPSLETRAPSVVTTHVEKQMMDPATPACRNFYGHVCGGFTHNVSMPNTSIGLTHILSIDSILLETQKRSKALLENGVGKSN